MQARKFYTMQHTTTPHTGTHCNNTNCNTLQHIATTHMYRYMRKSEEPSITHCNTTATYCNTGSYPHICPQHTQMKSSHRNQILTNKKTLKTKLHLNNSPRNYMKYGVKSRFAIILAKPYPTKKPHKLNHTWTKLFEITSSIQYKCLFEITWTKPPATCVRTTYNNVPNIREVRLKQHYRVATTHRVPYLYGSFSAKVTYI